MTSSRLAVDQWGRPTVVVTTGVAVGHVFLVISLYEIFEPRGRPPSPREMAAARVPYNAPAPLLERTKSEVPDDQLDEQAAIAAAYREQRRAPADLVNVAA